MQKMSTRVRLGIFAMALVTLSACAAQYRNTGYVPRQEQLADLTVGFDTRESLATSIGAPTAQGMQKDGTWYYVGSRFRQFAWQEAREVDRQVVALSFDSRGVLSNVERFGLDDGRVVALSRRVTDDNIKGVTFLQQLLGGLGQISADQLIQ
jgi:outer membrane protein assembly factor BamE (lipoprotein component of BamABCDE complex)